MERSTKPRPREARVATSPPPELSNSCALAYGMRAQYQNSRSSTIIKQQYSKHTLAGPYTTVFLRREREKEQNRRDSPGDSSRGRLEPPPELRRTPSRASPRCDGGQTRYLPPGGRGGAEADRGHRWRSRCPKKSRRSPMNLDRHRPLAHYRLRRRRSWTHGRGRHSQGNTQRGDHLPRTPSHRGWHHRRT